MLVCVFTLADFKSAIKTNKVQYNTFLTYMLLYTDLTSNNVQTYRIIPLTVYELYECDVGCRCHKQMQLLLLMN